jgi:aspartyl aminopeptidase
VCSDPPETMAMNAKQLAEKACTYLSASTDPYHAVQNAMLLLDAAGFIRLMKGPSNNVGTFHTEICPGGKYYYTVQNSTLVAFAVGKQVSPASFGFHIIGGHTDSPNFRIKPKSNKTPKKASVTQLSVECYGGGLWHTWFDRDLSISGKVLVRDSTPDASFSTPSEIQQTLVQLKDPVARISTLCIHLQSAAEREAFAVNREDHTSPIISSNPIGDTEKQAIESSILEQITKSGDPWLQGQDPILLQRIASELQVDVTQIADFDLSLYDVQPATIGGIHQDFIYSGRLDNLATVFTAVTALSHHDVAPSFDVSMIVCFDHEEVGSVSANGAGSPVLHEAVQFVSTALGNTSAAQHSSSIQKSFCLSIDQAHAVHPNYSSKHDPIHSPVMNGGIVIKTNSNQRYTTNSVTGFVLRELGRMCKVPIQEFCGTKSLSAIDLAILVANALTNLCPFSPFLVRNDCPCGSTIGPTISALTGIRTVDAGMPQLSMHSCREVMGVQDLWHGLQLFTGFFQHFRVIDDKIGKTIS